VVIELRTAGSTTWHAKGRRGSAARSGLAASLETIGRDRKFLLLYAWLVVVFLFGGGSRGDIQSLVLLRPAAILVLAYGLIGLTTAQVKAHRFLFALAAVTLVFVMLHLLPLPPQLWRALPGREIIAEIDREASLGEVWRPLTLVPHATRNALWALTVPLAALVLGVQLTHEQRTNLLPLVLSLGGLSALVGLLQTLGDPQGPLYFYRVTNNGSAVGLFANRNHQAVFLATLLPMLVVWARLRQAGRSAGRSGRGWQRWWPALAAIAFIIPLVLVTGSRSGAIVSLLALLLLPLILAGTFGRRREGGGTGEERRGKLWIYLVPGGIAGLVLLTALLGRATAFDRLMASGPGDEMRVLILPTLFAMIAAYTPWGTGIGTFEHAYRLHEPRELLGPTYMNHAHNDWLEAALTGGVPAVLLLAIAAVAFVARAIRLAAPADADARELIMARLGLAVILILALASMTDYPLRVPSLACLAVIAALWASPERSRRANPINNLHSPSKGFD
jgi:O-antigen ligase